MKGVAKNWLIGKLRQQGSKEIIELPDLLSSTQP